MEISEIYKVIRFDTKEALVKCLLYLKLSEKGVQLSDNELNILTLFSGNDNKDDIITVSLQKKYIKSRQSGENCVSKLTNLGLINKQGIGKRKMNTEFFPEIKSDYVAATYKIHNLNASI